MKLNLRQNLANKEVYSNEKAKKWNRFPEMTHKAISGPSHLYAFVSSEGKEREEGKTTKNLS